MSTEAQLSESEKKKEDWMNSKWRPMMGWLYMAVCAFDFVLFPIMYAVINALTYRGALPPGVPAQWQPLTLQGAGLFHIAMGAVLGIAAFGRTQEKLNGANNGGAQLPSGGFATPGVPSSNPTPTTNSWGSQPLGSGSGFGSTPATPAATGFAGGTGTGASTFGSAPASNSFNSAQVVTGFGGKPAPVQPPDPVL